MNTIISCDCYEYLKDVMIKTATAMRNFNKTLRTAMNIKCNCHEYPEEAYKTGEDLLTDDFARECIDCGRVILPDEFSEIIEERDYKLNKELK